MPYARCNIPYHIHEFIGTTTARLKKAIGADPREAHPEPHTVNILWYNPLIGGDVHFTPWRVDSGESDIIGGTSSEYFKGLLELAPLPVPSPEDIEILSEYIARTSQATSQLLFDFEALPQWKSAGTRSLVRNLLNVFCDCVRTKNDKQKKAVEKIDVLFEAKLLLPVIHTLLAAIPQYPFAKGQLFRETGWKRPQQKLNAWQSAKDAADPGTAMFVLLSVVESLQWRTNHFFYVIPDLKQFLEISSDPDTERYIQHQGLSLSRLAIYLTTPSMNTDQRNAFELRLKKHLVHWVTPLSSLLRAVNKACFHNSLLYSDELYNWLSDRWARGLLGVAASSQVIFGQEYISSDNYKKIRIGKRIRMSDHELIIPPSMPGRPTKLAMSLLEPWGIYQEDTGNIDEDTLKLADTNETCFWQAEETFAITDQEKSLHTYVICSLERDNKYFKDATANGRFCAGELLHDVCFKSIGLLSNVSNKWFNRAFGEYYFLFDQIRHNDSLTKDLRIRKDCEGEFYIRQLTKYTSALMHSINVLDIGIGYGRLEKKIQSATEASANEALKSATFWGLDVSMEMRRRHDEYLRDYALGERYKIGEMLEISEIFPEKEFFDIIIIAFTTFGCYNSEVKNKQSLINITRFLRPGGVLIIEQFNPFLEHTEMPYWIKTNCDKEGRQVTLEKTSLITKQIEPCSLYSGQYLYSEMTPEGPRIIRQDDYCVHLYHPSWFIDTLEYNGFNKSDIQFYSDFTDKTFQGQTDECLMVCIAQKEKTENGNISEETRIKAETRIAVVTNLMQRVSEDLNSTFVGTLSSEENIVTLYNALKNKCSGLPTSVAATWSDSEFSIIEKANSAKPSEWLKNNLLLKALQCLTSLINGR